MSPEQQPEQPMSMRDVINEFLDNETLLNGLDSLEEQERAQRVAEIDAANAVLALQEEIDALRKRARAGEEIDPNHRAHLQQLLLDAQVRFIEIHGPPA